MYQSTKVVDGFSTCFRQWKANSHCNQLHGYALKFKLTFQSETLDNNNWVMDFGFLKSPLFFSTNLRKTFKDWFSSRFDHTTIIASDDPHLKMFKEMNEKGLIDLIVLDDVGCEAFSKYVFDVLKTMLRDKGELLYSVECIENDKNSAIYIK